MPYGMQRAVEGELELGVIPPPDDTGLAALEDELERLQTVRRCGHF